MIANTIDQEIKAAMLARDQVKLRGLRAIKAAILLARTEKGQSEDITEETELKILHKLIKQRKESADIYRSQGREDLSHVEEEEVGVISSYLPAQLSRDAVEKIVAGLITASGASSVKDMGKVMALANKELGGKAEGKLIAEVVKALLA